MEVSLSATQAKGSDRRRQVGAVFVAIVAATALAGILGADDIPAGAASLMVLPIPFAAWAGTIYAFTEVDATGIRTRRWLPKHQVPWTHVQKIAVVGPEYVKSDRQGDRGQPVQNLTRKVEVVDAYDHLITLGVPNMSSTFDPHFNTEVERIQASCVGAREEGRAPSPYRLVRGPSRLLLITMCCAAAVAIAGLILITAYGRSDWEAHRGQGTAGTYTVTSARCTKQCVYTGDFTSASGGDDRRGVGLGAASDSLVAGQKVAAIDVGRGGVYSASGDDAGIIADWVLETVAGVLGAYTVTKLACDSLRRRREVRSTRS